MDKKIYAYKDLSFSNKDELFDFAHDILFKDGYVKESFCSEIKNREKEYPTGIESDVNFSLCHVDLEHVIKNALVVILLKEPLEFVEMSEKERIVNVKVVYILAFKDSSSHLSALQKVVSTMSEESASQIFDWSVVEITEHFMNI